MGHEVGGPFGEGPPAIQADTPEIRGVQTRWEKLADGLHPQRTTWLLRLAKGKQSPRPRRREVSHVFGIQRFSPRELPSSGRLAADEGTESQRFGCRFGQLLPSLM